MRRLELIRQPKLDYTTLIACIPLTLPDPSGRPIIIIKPRELQTTSSNELRCLLCTYMEGLCVRLQQLNFNHDVKEPPVLQYIVLFDMEGTSLSSAVRSHDLVELSVSLIIPQGWMEVLSVFKQYVLPMFPGMIAAGVCLSRCQLSAAAALRSMTTFSTDGSHHAVFVLNHTWHISSAWTFARHVSSSTALYHDYPNTD